ncbi:MAG: MaoC/PaaZ C-terminal domain-containing protein [Pseudomonadales bacterium]|nr:MaoC/PaaZ C-terminal domain-containing protein [Pseudomonadales bacterium]
MNTAIGKYNREYLSRVWDEVSEGDELPKLEMPVSYRRVIQDVAATRDFFPGHHNPEYAKKQKVKDIYLNTMFLQGLVDRYVSDWSGPEAFIRKRKIHMQVSIAAGDTIHINGKVTRKYEQDNEKLVEVDVQILNQDDVPCCPSSVVLRMPT